MALGQELVRNLQLDARGATLERWLAHHLAELMAQAAAATGPERADAETRAVELILRLWAMRRSLPAAADPLGGLRGALSVLSRMAPSSNPWEEIARREPQEQLFRDLFNCMATTVVGTLLLTLCQAPRQATSTEQAAMEAVELELHKHLEWWGQVVKQPSPRVHVRFNRANGPAIDDVDDDTPSDSTSNAEVQAVEAGGIDGDSGQVNVSNLQATIRQVITEKLECFQAELAELVRRWKATNP